MIRCEARPLPLKLPRKCRVAQRNGCGVGPAGGPNQTIMVMKKLNERHIAVISLAMVVIAMCAVGVGDALLAALSGTAYLTVGIATVTIATEIGRAHV